MLVATTVCGKQANTNVATSISLTQLQTAMLPNVTCYYNYNYIKKPRKFSRCINHQYWNILLVNFVTVVD